MKKECSLTTEALFFWRTLEMKQAYKELQAQAQILAEEENFVKPLQIKAKASNRLKCLDLCTVYL